MLGGAAGTLAVGGVASGAGTSYSGSPSGATSGAGGLLGTTAFSCTAQPLQASTCTGKVGAYTITVTIPAGTFQFTEQTVVTDGTAAAPSPAACSQLLVGFGVGFFENSTKVTGSFNAVTTNVSGPGIGQSTQLLRIVGSTAQTYASTVSGGAVNFTITSDPNFELVNTGTCAAAATSPIAGATQVNTGKPFLLEGGIAGVLVLGGGGLLFGLRRRRHTL